MKEKYVYSDRDERAMRRDDSQATKTSMMVVKIMPEGSNLRKRTWISCVKEDICVKELN